MTYSCNTNPLIGIVITILAMALACWADTADTVSALINRPDESTVILGAEGYTSGGFIGRAPLNSADNLFSITSHLTYQPCRSFSLQGEHTSLVLDYSGDSLLVSGDMPLSEGAQRFMDFADQYLGATLRDLRRENDRLSRENDGLSLENDRLRRELEALQ